MEEVIERNVKCCGRWFTLKMSRDNTVRKERYYLGLRNPFRDNYESKILYGSSVEVLEKKAVKKLEEWYKKSEEGVYDREAKRRAEYQKALQQSGEEDSIPFS